LLCGRHWVRARATSCGSLSLQGLGLTLAGLVIGLWSSFALVQYLTKFLYGVPDYDAISFLAVSAVVGIVAIAASAAPAWGASRVDPMQVLRSG